ncbi:MAG: hypothetical protein WBR11_07650 [Terriglobales bacterium]
MKPKELIWAEDEVTKNGGSVVASGEAQENGSIAFVNFRTRAGHVGQVTIDLKQMSSEKRVRELVRAALLNADSPK